jgi:integration host factor subunit alpha
MTKAEIVQALYTRVGGFSKKESADIVDLVFEMMKETLGRGEKIKISERRVLTFKASQILKQALNAKEKGTRENGGTVNHSTSNGSSASAGGGGLSTSGSGGMGVPLAAAASEFPKE